MRQMARLGLLDRIGTRWTTSKIIDGMWVGVASYYEGVDGEDAEAGLGRVEEALCLIKEYDRLRYGRITRDLDRIWVRLVPHYAGLYTAAYKLCELDCKFVARASIDVIASTIVHEATHARLRRCGIGGEEAIRARLEEVCLRREIAFAAKLPNGETLREMAEKGLEDYAVDELHTDAERTRLRREALIREFRELGLSEWTISAFLLFIRTWRGISIARYCISNFVRRLINGQLGHS